MPHLPEEPINLPEIVDEVRSVFEAYEAALKRNDAATLNELFWNSPYALRYGIAEQHLGIAAIREWRAHAPPILASRRLRNTVITSFGRDTASVCTEFLADDVPGVGRQTQMWVRFKAGWRIVAAHVSIIDCQ